MERLKSLIPDDLKRVIGESTPENLTISSSLILDFLRSSPQFQQVISASLSVSWNLWNWCLLIPWFRLLGSWQILSWHSVGRTRKLLWIRSRKEMSVLPRDNTLKLWAFTRRSVIFPRFFSYTWLITSFFFVRIVCVSSLLLLIF